MPAQATLIPAKGRATYTCIMLVPSPKTRGGRHMLNVVKLVNFNFRAGDKISKIFLPAKLPFDAYIYMVDDVLESQ
jgi:hypothetical protein